jgi:hypothetical protein
MRREREIGYIYPKVYTVGVDLGQSQDPTALVVVETEVTKRVYRVDGVAEPRQKVESLQHRVRHAERLPLQLPYPEQVAYVRGLLASPELPRGAELVADMTGVGRPVFDLFEAEGLKPIGIVITGGLEEQRDGARVFRVPKITLVSRLQASLHAGELKFAVGLSEEQAFKSELSEFRMRHTDTGRLTFGAREGRHDDLVLSLAIALWHAQRRVKGSNVATMVPLLGI